MKLEQLNNGNWLINGVEYAPVEDEKDRLLKRLQEESEGWEVFFGGGEEPDKRYHYELFSESNPGWVIRDQTRRLDSPQSRVIYRRRLKYPRELPAVPIDPDQLPARVTSRGGMHYTATQSISGKYVLCAERDRTGHWITVALDGFFLESKKHGEYDVIHVGKWLTDEELEAMRNE